MILGKRPDIERFLSRPDASVRAALIYGRDLGVVRERGHQLAARIVANPDDPFDVAQLTDGDLDSDGGRLEGELAAQSLMGGRRLVRLKLGSDKAGPDRTATEAASTNPTGPDLAGARARLENALTADDAERLAAVQFVDNAGIRPDQAGDFDFSLALARVLLKLLAASAADDPAKRRQDLRTVVGVIATDANTAAKLKDDLANARYTSGDPALDTELTTELGG